jgi:hypothetical protein
MKILANFFKQKASQTHWPCQSIRCYTFTYCVHHTLNTKNNLFQSQQSKTLSPKNPVHQAKVQTRRSKPGSNYVSKLPPITRDIPNKEKNEKLKRITSLEEPSLTKKKKK